MQDPVFDSTSRSKSNYPVFTIIVSFKTGQGCACVPIKPHFAGLLDT